VRITCLVKGCSNHSDAGRMIGALCSPCDRMLRTGIPNVGYDWVTELNRKNESLRAAFVQIGLIMDKVLNQ
jgi:hypothetical protein